MFNYIKKKSMKKRFLGFVILTATLILACKSEGNKVVAKYNKAGELELIDSTFARTIAKDLTKITQLDRKKFNPVVVFSKAAKVASSKFMVLDTTNIKMALEVAKEFKHSIVVKGIHTMAEMTDYTDCIQSGSWNTCMPKAHGYVLKKGQWIEKEEYLNNIIGTPSNKQKTVMYVFE